MNESLKKTFLMIPFFLILEVSALVFGELVFVMYYNVQHLVAGNSTSFFSLAIFVAGFFTVFPIVVVLTPLLLTFYRLRHSGGGVLPVVMYFILCAAMWTVFYPTFIRMKNKTSRTLPEVQTKLTSNYFREVGENNFFILENADEKNARGIVIDKTKTDTSIISYANFSSEDLQTVSFPFHDSLISQTVEKFPSWIQEGFFATASRAEYALRAGFKKWLGFLSFALALTAVYMLTFVSEWRLVNVAYFLIVEAGVFALNTLYYSDFANQFRNLQLPFFGNIFISVDEPFLVLLNLAIAGLCFIIGVLASLSYAKKRRTV